MKKILILTMLLFISISFFILQKKEDNNLKLGEYLQKYDLSTISGREYASISKEISPYELKKCIDVKHTDGEIMTFCIAKFNGTTGGFYNPDKELMVVGSFNQYTLIHEITHATILHYYKKGYTDILSSETQEKMAYNAENLLMQIIIFKEDFNFIKGKDLSLVDGIKRVSQQDINKNIGTTTKNNFTGTTSILSVRSK